MSDAKVCDRCEVLFSGPPLVAVQFGQRQGELCDDCAEEFEEFWTQPDTESQSAESGTQTLGERLSERDQE